jgi:hypothetical protein
MNWAEYISGILLGVIVGFGVGCVLCEYAFLARIREKAETGIRIESGGRFYTVHSVEVDE